MATKLTQKKKFKNNGGEGKGTYGPDIGRDEDDDRERTEPGVSNGEEDIARYLRSGEVPESQNHHPHRQRQRDQVEHPHLSLSIPKRIGGRPDRCKCFQLRFAS